MEPSRFSWGRGALIALLLLLSIVSWHYAYRLYVDNKAALILQLADIAEKIALPYRIAELSAREPDRELLVPVLGVRTRDIGDTWGAARSEGRTHEGVDIFAPRGTPVLAAVPGYVVRVGENRLGGTYVFTIGAGGRRYYYAHLDSVALDIEVGAEVGPNTILGFVGNTGNASGTPPHLHFGMYTSDGPQNPYDLLVERE